MAEEAFYDWKRPIFEGQCCQVRGHVPNGRSRGTDKTGHFTQAVWKNVQYVGCYTARCEPGTVFDATYGVSPGRLDEDCC
jgi:hypothetical protein